MGRALPQVHPHTRCLHHVSAAAGAGLGGGWGPPSMHALACTRAAEPRCQTPPRPLCAGVGCQHVSRPRVAPAAQPGMQPCTVAGSATGCWLLGGRHARLLPSPPVLQWACAWSTGLVPPLGQLRSVAGWRWACRLRALLAPGRVRITAAQGRALSLDCITQPLARTAPCSGQRQRHLGHRLHQRHQRGACSPACICA